MAINFVQFTQWRQYFSQCMKFFCGPTTRGLRSSGAGAPVHWTAWTPGFYATVSLAAAHLSLQQNFNLLFNSIVATQCTESTAPEWQTCACKYNYVQLAIRWERTLTTMTYTGNQFYWQRSVHLAPKHKRMSRSTWTNLYLKLGCGQRTKEVTEHFINVTIN